MTRYDERPVLTAPKLHPAPPPPAPPFAVTRYQRLVKPVLDRALAALLLLLASPVLAVVGLAVLVSLGRPVLLRQQRVGRHGRAFEVYKFRTMLPDRRQAAAGYSGSDRRRTHTHPLDPRHTPVGRLLRRYSLDELPQLLNVVRGQMSLVGPRPELVGVVASYQPWQHARHAVRPGLTGLWQVTERGNGLMHEHTEIDLRYAERVTFLGDLSILLRTVPTLLGRDCAGE